MSEVVVSEKLTWYNLSIKRFIDLFCSIGLMIVIGWWLFPIVALLIKLDSPGPIFYVQSRGGIYNSMFNCYKFRSMTISHKDDLKQATRNDPRVTKVGRILRKTSIDELPQVFNVIYGNMSLVGPRPLILAQNKENSKIIEGYENRHLVKPGITGLAQAKGYRGETELPNSIYFRFKLDMYYIKHWSVIFDLKLIWITAKTIFSGDENAY
ncbi:putative colanic acid biosynthesis UDP-glucose lipid carrier transferase [Algoriphagus ratkowskyi]|uniref:Polyprenyl glycosylphosphotransferase n=1 Tax=Algoriphagus ratkowskyi TaxID=57028 RepID=A0A2W7RET8_9BACT|nr:sugar transferase [Algoriphagus ratkowskyi]PZX52739.1 putative colanic acid biosynthesis UDP-glucose lipid carrier transferase [Algoriphagus ratkowskyi]TXD76313.1 polyprenyl glycosylphosphotransferase [Algoriphagus ratkowskyi]